MNREVTDPLGAASLRWEWTPALEVRSPNKKFPGNITQSYRTRHPLRIVDELQTWIGHSLEVLQGMLEGIARLREQGLDLIED